MYPSISAGIEDARGILKQAICNEVFLKVCFVIVKNITFVLQQNVLLAMKAKFLLLLLLLLGFTKLSFSQTTVQDRWLLKDLADREIGFVTFYYSWTWGDGGATSNVNPINIIATHSGDYLTLSNAIEEDLDESGMYWSADENLINYLAKYDSIGNMYWHLDLITNSGYDQGNNTSYRNGKPYFPNLLFENLVGNYVVVGTIRDTSSPQRPDSTCFATVSNSGVLLSRKNLPLSLFSKIGTKKRSG